MLSVVRMYPSEDQARTAIRMLEEEELTGHNLHLFSPAPGSEAQIIEKAIAHEQLPSSHIHACTRALQKGQYILTVVPPFIRGREAEIIMDSCGPVDTDALPEYYPSNGTPLSDLLGIPTLASYKHTFNMKQLTKSSWSFSSKFGLGMLSSKSTPLSSMFGMKTLTQSKSKTSSFGMSLLSKKATPLSSMFGMKTLSKPKSKRSSFGLPLISHNPAPLSNLFNLRLLSKED
ncbi:MAG: hypothetical protein AB8F65_07545 [Woeseiaceae bacterium]